MKYKFVRYGRLKPVKQKGYTSDSFHSPPRRRGFYAFPFGMEESFLVAGLGYQPNVGLPTVVKYETNRWYNHITNEFEIDVYDWEVRDIWRVKHYFELSGEKPIWHHLEEQIRDKSKILAKSKSWCCTTIADWHKAFNICCNQQRTASLFMFRNPEDRSSILEIRREGYYSRDHFEVFLNIKV